MKRLIPFIALFSFFHSFNALAQEETDAQEDLRYENWYQIELVIFERVYDSNSEIWPKNLQLEYPEGLEFLFSEEEWLNFTLIESEENSDALNTVDNATFTTDTQKVIDQPPMETPRIFLNNDQFELSQEARKLRNRSAYRVLFHNAWREQLEPTELSKAIPISGGEQFEGRSELEGWIRISLDRFLHLDSYLWKVDYELNYGQETDYWPPIPLQPKPEQVSNAEEIPDEDVQLGFSQYFNAGKKTIDVDAQSLKSQLSLDAYDSIEKSPYVVNRIVTLKQKRRMRSEELHYIDHPKLGILARVTPYTVYLPEEDKTEDIQTDVTQTEARTEFIPDQQ